MTHISPVPAYISPHLTHICPLLAHQGLQPSCQNVDFCPYLGMDVAQIILDLFQMFIEVSRVILGTVGHIMMVKT